MAAFEKDIRIKGVDTDKIIYSSCRPTKHYNISLITTLDKKKCQFIQHKRFMKINYC